MYKCSICGTIFDEPISHKYIENLDGENGIETRLEELCPICGAPYFDEITLKEGLQQ